MILDRVEADRKDSVPDEVTFAKVMAVLMDPISWSFGARRTYYQRSFLLINDISCCAGLMFMASTMPAYAVGFFITPILLSMGYSVSESLLLSAPPSGAAVSTTLVYSFEPV